jgi:cytochrome c oxidase subunit 2
MSLLSRSMFVFLGFVLSLCSLSAHALPPMNLPYGVTPVSHEIYDLHMAIFYICCVIGVLVFGVLMFSLIKFRKSKGAIASTTDEHLGLEILWTVIPFIILIVMAVPATKVLLKIHDTSRPDLDIKITGFQWKWKYEYLNEGISFFSNLSTPQDQIQNKVKKNKWYLLQVDHPLVLPVHEKIRFLITANDVIHSWWVPELGVKQDAIPGYINENWATIEKPGIYRGECAELCGANHGFMPIVVKAVSKADFKKWVAEQEGKQQEKTADANKPMTKDELMKIGKATYSTSCAACHQAEGQGMPPTFPALKGSPLVIGPINKQVRIVLDGKTGTAMQAFANQLDDQTIAAVITYTRNAWGNDKLTTKNKQALIIQPSAIKKAR